MSWKTMAGKLCVPKSRSLNGLAIFVDHAAKRHRLAWTWQRASASTCRQVRSAFQMIALADLNREPAYFTLSGGTSYLPRGNMLSGLKLGRVFSIFCLA